ncbi:MAG TPA: xanthine dehydrogenase family protein molybdopterin-binding subunit [Caulobacteraceae bacterium]|jgi:xanthine dehydrogenase YagR molybdenum-binding subunit|nr:xanthine dehydrogenase family protein molybdopterin-binding subunit [Caulobacteraceae bacterium]
MSTTLADYAAPNPISRNRSGVIGRAVDRYEGPLKVSGTAPYAYEVETPSPPVYGVLVEAAIGCGVVTAVDDAAARAAPGVKLVWHAFHRPADQPEKGARSYVGSQSGAKPVFAEPNVRFFGQPVAFVAADTLENACFAAELVRVTYEETPGDFVFDPLQGEICDGESRVGDFEAAFAEAPIQLDETYSTPIENHCQMEPCATTAWWDGEVLTVHTSVQMVKPPQHLLAETLRIPRANVHLLSRYIGGGFGGKGSTYEDLEMAAMASRALGQPVKIALTRRQMFNATVHRPATVQRVRLGATPDGRLTAFALEAVTHCARGAPFIERAANFSRGLYAAPNRLTGHALQTLDIAVASAMRAPGEASGMLSLECAMDQLAEQLGLDPIELRIRNEAEVDPETGHPHSARQLVECMTDGARSFGWDKRNPRPGQVRDGEWLVGMGMAAAIRGNFLLPAKAAMRVEADGRVIVRQGMTDIGTGSYTIIAQIAAETMGVPIERVVVEIGDSGFAPAPGSGGQFGAASAGSAVYEGGMLMRRTLAGMAAGDPASPIYGAAAEDIDFRDGLITASNKSETLAALVSRLMPSGVEVVGDSTPVAESRTFSQHAYGAHFVEVGVNIVTGEPRLRRMLGVFACGRILNAKTARSQITGGMIWGVGQALSEFNAVDPRYGSLIAQDLGGYLAPVHADIVDLDAYFLDEVDDKANPLGIKGVGEVGICGAGAAVANAIYNACGARIRDYPITPDKLLPFLPELI